MRTAWKIRIELKGIRPIVWRRVLVSDRTTLPRLHEVIQDVFGWQDYHLHEFRIHGVRYGVPYPEEDDDEDLTDEADARLQKLGLAPGSPFSYLYDFGDNWEHSLRVEEILTVEAGARMPVCLGGGRACPPEDVGGIGGYAGFLEALADEAHPEHHEYLEWIGGSFDPERFEISEANRRLRRGPSLRRAASWDVPSEAQGRQRRPTIISVAQHALSTPASESTARELALRRDVGALLEYLRDHSVTGTQSTGNLPLKAVAEISTRFVSPPALEDRIGTHVYRFRSEEDVPAVFFAHVLARGADLLEGGPGRRWRLTEEGAAFLSAPAFGQVCALLASWWYHVDWLVKTRFGVFGDDIPSSFRQLVLTIVQKLPVGSPVQFEPFADRLIVEGGWTWEPTSYDIRGIVVSGLQHMVVDALEEFGVVSTRRVKTRAEFGETSRLESFSPTDFGQALLGALASLQR